MDFYCRDEKVDNLKEFIVRLFKGKLERKNLDFIVLNSLKDANACFGYDTNKITIIERNGNSEAFCLKSKTEVAKDIIDKICNDSCHCNRNKCGNDYY